MTADDVWRRAVVDAAAEVARLHEPAPGCDPVLAAAIARIRRLLAYRPPGA